MNTNPENIEFEKVVPLPTLGQNFDKKLMVDLSLSTKAVIYGDKSGDATEPVTANLTDSPYKNFKELKDRTLQLHGSRCAFCGFVSRQNDIHNLNDNHSNIEADNLTVADPICHAWQHLGEQKENASYLAYLPGLTATDVNHLQRTILVALASEDAFIRADAKELMNWMASHRKYVFDVWQSYEPTVFASVLKRLDPELRQNKVNILNELALIVNPSMYGKYVTAWKSEAYRMHPQSTWPGIYHKYMHSA